MTIRRSLTNLTQPMLKSLGATGCLLLCVCYVTQTEVAEIMAKAIKQGVIGADCFVRDHYKLAELCHSQYGVMGQYRIAELSKGAHFVVVDHSDICVYDPAGIKTSSKIQATGYRDYLN